MSIKSYISIGIASLSVVAGAGAAQAAALQGRVGLNPPTPTGGVQTGVILTGTGATIPGTSLPATDFDFVPPNGGGNGPIVEINANPISADNPANDFAPFVGQTGTIKDVTALELNGLLTGAITINEFISIPGAFSVTATSITTPVYSFENGGTTVAIGVEADFFNLSDGSNNVSQGVGTFSIDFAGLSIAETQALYDEPGEQPVGFTPGTWSSNFVVEAPDQQIPEASNLLGLLVIGLGGATMLARKK